MRVRAWIGFAATLASLLAGAATAAPARAADASEEFLLGMDAYEAGRTEEARAAFARAVEADPANGRALLLLGMTELELGRPDAAVQHFRSAPDADPSLEALALYHEGLALAETSRVGEARAALERAILVDPGSRAAAGARGLLAALDSREPARRFRLATSLGIEFESNVSVPEIDASSGQGDGAFVADLAASYRLLRSERAAVEVGYDFAQSLHFDLREADLRSHGLWLDGSHAAGPVDLGLGYRFGTATLGGDGFLNLHELRPRLELPIRPGFGAELSVAYLNKDFLDSNDRDRDAHRASAGVESFSWLADRKVRVDAGARFEAEEARGPEFDYLGLSLGSGLHLPFAWRGEWTLELGYRLRLRDYANETPSIGEPRLDLEHGLRLSLARRIAKRVEARLDYRLTAADSNLPAADYLDSTVGLSLRLGL